ncbi:cuticle protein 8-like [Macrobrachium rosenbergii]|uniref:cuticle protein 8-like n=1 Tax=Macrobrachium rosenbergii TaxID=79674 RepID=UPI0034D60207
MYLRVALAALALVARASAKAVAEPTAEAEAEAEPKAEAEAADIAYGPPIHHAPVHAIAKLPYEFGYGVSDAYTGTDYSRSETSDGNVVKGSYHVLLPDGRKQIVTYTADDYGFHAKKDGHRLA